MHRATIAQQKSADGRVATGAAWLKGRNSQGGREEQKHPYKKRKKERKTYLTLTGPLMEGVSPPQPQPFTGGDLRILDKLFTIAHKLRAKCAIHLLLKTALH